MQRAMKIFISYARKDEAFRAQLLVFLTGMQRRGLIAPWHDRLIEGGSDWRADIRRELETCDLALLLVSAEFLHSDFIHSEELAYLMQRRQEQGIRVLPLIVRPCDWEHEEIGKLAVLPANGKPLITFSEADGARDQAWTEIGKQIRAMAEDFQRLQAQPLPQEQNWMRDLAAKAEARPPARPDVQALYAGWPQGNQAVRLEFCSATGVARHFNAVGGEYLLKVTLDYAGNLLLFAQDESGVLRHLYPHLHRPDPWLEAGSYFLPGQLLRLPLPGQTENKWICGTKGRERVCGFLLPQLPPAFKLLHLAPPLPLTLVSTESWVAYLAMLRACIGTRMALCEMVVGGGICIPDDA